MPRARRISGKRHAPIGRKTLVTRRPRTPTRRGGVGSFGRDLRPVADPIRLRFAMRHVNRDSNRGPTPQSRLDDVGRRPGTCQGPGRCGRSGAVTGKPPPLHGGTVRVTQRLVIDQSRASASTPKTHRSWHGLGLHGTEGGPPQGRLHRSRPAIRLPAGPADEITTGPQGRDALGVQGWTRSKPTRELIDDLTPTRGSKSRPPSTDGHNE